mmetsp:Transcript_76707/g.201282  ORF Transcript_76707/g.201282 Transcript_76707/m.201282 type:complete len:442 (+) Transcript_76707:984-2309(+)
MLLHILHRVRPLGLAEDAPHLLQVLLGLLLVHPEELEVQRDEGLGLILHATIRHGLRVRGHLQAAVHAAVRMDQEVLLPEIEDFLALLNAQPRAVVIVRQGPLTRVLGDDIGCPHQVEVEGRDHARKGVAATAAREPEQVGVVLSICLNEGAVRQDRIHARELVDEQPVLPGEDALAAAERDSRKADRGARSARDGEALVGKPRVGLAQVEPGFEGGKLLSDGDVDLLHAVDVDEDAARLAIADVCVPAGLRDHRKSCPNGAQDRLGDLLPVLREYHHVGIQLVRLEVVVQRPQLIRVADPAVSATAQDDLVGALRLAVRLHGLVEARRHLVDLRHQRVLRRLPLCGVAIPRGLRWCWRHVCGVAIPMALLLDAVQRQEGGFLFPGVTGRPGAAGLALASARGPPHAAGQERGEAEEREGLHCRAGAQTEVHRPESERERA